MFSPRKKNFIYRSFFWRRVLCPLLVRWAAGGLHPTAESPWQFKQWLEDLMRDWDFDNICSAEAPAGHFPRRAGLWFKCAQHISAVLFSSPHGASKFYFQILFEIPIFTFMLH